MSSPQQSMRLKRVGAGSTWLRSAVFFLLWVACAMLLLVSAPAGAGDYTYTFEDIVVNESDGTADLTVLLNQSVLSGEEITIRVRDDDSESSARKGRDYRNPPNRITISPGQDRGIISVPIIDDTPSLMFMAISPFVSLASLG